MVSLDAVLSSASYWWGIVWNEQRWALWSSLCLLAIPLAQPFLALNVTPSLPTGLYARTSISPSSSLSEDQVVTFCLDPVDASFASDRGYIPQRKDFPVVYNPKCPQNLVPLAKRVVGFPGDTVRVTLSGTFVRGRKISPPPPRCDSKSRSIPVLYGRHVLGSNQFWLASDHYMGFDSRVSGPIHGSQMVSRLTPVLFFGSQKVDPTPSASSLRLDCTSDQSPIATSSNTDFRALVRSAKMSDLLPVRPFDRPIEW